MTCTLLEKLDLPKSCWLGSVIYKKQFLTAGDLSSADKKLVSKHIDKVIWHASLKPNTINIRPYQDEAREYGEVEIIEVRLNEASQVRRIAEIVMRTIPYPILLQLTLEEKLMIVAGHSRINLSDSSKNTIEEFLFTDWINPGALTEFQIQFFENIHSSKLSFLNFYLLYNSFVDQVILLNASKWADCYFGSKDVQEVKKITIRIANLERKVEELRTALKQETQFNRQVELNVSLKRVQKEKEYLVRDYLIAKRS
jgi:hypothetical protein